MVAPAGDGQRTRPVWEAVVLRAAPERERGGRRRAAAAALALGVAAVVAVAAPGGGGGGGRPRRADLLQAPAAAATSLKRDERLVAAAQLRLQQQALLLHHLESEDAHLMRLDEIPDALKELEDLSPAAGCHDMKGNPLRKEVCSDAMMDMIKQPNHNNGQDGSLPPIFEPPYEPIAKEAEAIMGRTERGPTEPFQEPRPVHAAPLTPAEETAAVWPGADFDDPKASVDDTPPQVLQQNAASGTDCEAITDIELWLDCEMNKRGQPSPPPPPYVPPPPPPPVISPDPAEIDCDSTTTTIDEWFECEDNRRKALGGQWVR